jgi:hypothetical protein
MGSPLAPVIANFYMEHFEKLAISSANKNICCLMDPWKRRASRILKTPQQHPSQHKIQDGGRREPLFSLPRCPGKQETRWFTKTHSPSKTDTYLHAKSEHHPAQKKAVLTTPVQRARTICDADSLDAEINHLKKHSGKMVIAIVATTPQEEKAPITTGKANWCDQAALPGSIPNKISRLLNKYNIKTVHIPARKKKTCTYSDPPRTI